MPAKRSSNKKVTSSKASPKKPRMSAEEKRWRAQSDLETLQRAEQIKNTPSRIKEAQKMANEMQQVVKKV